MDRIGNLSSGHDIRLSDNEERDNTASSSSDVSVFGRTLWNTDDVEKPIFLSDSTTQEQKPPPVPLSSFNIDAVRTDTTNYRPLMLGEGTASVSTNTSNTSEPQFNPLHHSMPFVEQVPQKQVKIEPFPTLESRAAEIPISSLLPPDTESASTSSSERKTGVKRKLRSKNFASINKQRRKINDRERARSRREKAAFITLREKLGENYLPSDQNPMKLSKVKTLFGAIDYINNLTELLAQDSPEHSDTLREAGNNNNDK